MNRVLLVLVLVAACSSAACESRQGCIERVLREDAVASKQDNPTAVVRGMRKIKLSPCPEDFRDTYYSHISAWKEMSDVYEAAQKIEKPDGFLEAVATGVSALALGAAGLKASDDISRTFKDVERSALKHGAQLLTQ